MTAPARRWIGLGLVVGIILIGIVLPGTLLCFGNPQWHKQLFIWQTWLIPSRKWPWGDYTGTWNVWGQDGRAEFEWQYVRGQPHGRLRWFFDDGSLQGECWAEAGEDHGPWTVWYRGGTVMREQGEKHHRQKHGHWRYYYADGTLGGEGDYDRDQPIGIWRAWDSDGNLVAEGEYRAGAPWHGSFAVIDHGQDFWNEPFVLVQVNRFEAGQPVSSTPSSASPPPP